MNLAETIYLMNQRSQSAAQLTDLKIGTVNAVSPLEIIINTAMPPLKASVLLLTSAVVEKKIPILSHSHTTSGLSHSHTTGGLSHSHDLNGQQTSTELSGSYGSSSNLSGNYESSTQLSDIACYENGTALPVENEYIILNRALEVGDKVLLLRVQNGQKFIVLSRVFEEAT